jgi:hypothetical protein
MAIKVWFRLWLSGFVVFLLVLTQSGLAQAQAYPDGSLPLAASRSPSVTSLRRNIAAIFLSGIGGAILGLSTLSFYSDPPNHVSNITVGLGLGLIGGVSYVIADTYKASSDNRMALDPVAELKDRVLVSQAKALGPSFQGLVFDF